MMGTKTKRGDDELTRINRVLRELRAMKPDSARRVIDYVRNRIDEEQAALEPAEQEEPGKQADLFG